MNQIAVTLPDGSRREFPAGARVRDVAESISPRLAKAALAGVIDGKLVDLTAPLDRDASVRIVTDQSPEALTLYRHSTAHLLAAAVTNLFPDVQCGIGPATDEGFFYDFVVPRPFVPEDLDAIERKMRELAGADLIYERQMWPRDEAKAFFAGRGEPLKVQLIDEKTEGQREVSCYTIKDKDTFIDFCVGPHVPSTGRLKAFKLLNTSNAYWKGDARNQPMQRIYGTAFFAEKDLKAYLTQIEEAKKRDHRKLGKELGLFAFHPWAPGAAFWQDKGTTLYNTLANYMREVLLPNGYVEVKTPIIFNKMLWETSGHWSHYRQNMFQVQGSEGEEMALKAMNCPGHYLLYASEVHSYRELPIRFHEQTPLHRNELAGVLSGLTRVRQFSQDDGHCFVMPEQIGEEVERLLKLVRRVYGDLGMTFQPKLATRPDEYPRRTVHMGPGRSAPQERARQGWRDLHDRRGRRQFLRAEDRLRRHRCDRPEVAVRDDPARLSDAGAVRPEVRRRRQLGASRGGDPSGDFRQLRTVHRDPDRALRRGVPVVARAAAGDRPADFRQASRLRGRRAESAEGGRPAGRTGRPPGEDRL